MVWAQCLPPATLALLQGCIPGASAVEDGTGSSLEKGDTGPAVWGEDSLTQAALGGGSEP